MSRRSVLACIAALLFWSVAPVAADYYDNFDDRSYSGDPNGAWDIDDPCWIIMPLVGDVFVNDANDGELRLYVNSVYWPVGFIGAVVDAGDQDPNTSETFWDAGKSHYILTRVRNHGWKQDPNQDTGWVSIMLHANYATWQTFWVHYEFTDDRAWNGGYFTIEAQDGFDGQRLKGTTIRGWQPPPGDPNYYDPNLMWADPNYMDEHNGFWMCLQFQVVDANFPMNDPNGKWLKAACWNGGKFNWSGAWNLEADLGNPSSFRDDPNGWWPDRYWTSGACGAASFLGTGEIPPADAAFDNIEVRTGEWTNVSHTLTLTVSHSNWGSVEVDPNLVDPNNSAIQRYTSGTEVVLTATPVSGKSFKEWTIYDPNYPGDLGHAATDSNTVLYLTMNADWEVNANFKCGSGLEPLLGIGLLAMGIMVVIRRFR